MTKMSRANGDLSHHDANGDQPLQKRQRVAAACDECRNKKIKCDSNRPVCGPCVRRHGPNSVCNWGVRKVRSSGVSKEEMNQLKRRLEELENDRSYNESIERPTSRGASEISMSDQPPAAGGDNANERNAMMGLMEDEPQASSIHFADSSARSFMNQIKSTMSDQAHSTESQSTSPSKRSLMRPPPNRRLSTKSVREYVLPSRQRADHLLALYWRLVDGLYPFLDTEEVESFYLRLWTGGELGEDGSSFLCLLNIMFSIACKLDPATGPSERGQTADAFYQRAREFLDLDLLQHRSIITVQCLLLLGQYLQSTNDPQQCWIFVGLAIRVAQSLGLDLPSTSAEAEDIHECEVIRRVWHGCVLMDRTLSMTFGRPAVITAQAAAAVPRPLPHSGDHVCHCFTDSCPPNNHASSYHFFIEALKLYELMSETLLTLYNPASAVRFAAAVASSCSGALSPTDVGKILEIDKSLWSWNHGLPLHLRYEPKAVKSAPHHRQSNVLWLRHRHIRILLLRPVLSRFCSPQGTQRPAESPETKLAWHIALQCSVSCVQTAIETIEFLDAALSAHELHELDDILPAWWYSIFYVYSSATVLVAARLQPAIIAEVSEKAIMDGRHAVMRIFKKFSRFDKHATRCAAAVSVLFDQVPLQHPQNQQPSDLVQKYNRPGPSSRAHQRKSHTQNHGNGTTRSDNGRASSALLLNNASEFLTAASSNAGNPQSHNNPVFPVATPRTTVPEASAAVNSALSQDWALNGSMAYQAIGNYDPTTADDYSSIMGMVDSAEINIDLGGMSWLTSHPSQFYGNSML